MRKKTISLPNASTSLYVASIPTTVSSAFLNGVISTSRSFPRSEMRSRSVRPPLSTMSRISGGAFTPIARSCVPGFVSVVAMISSPWKIATPHPESARTSSTTESDQLIR